MVVAVCISATGSASAVNVVISHAPPTVCIHTPMLAITLADHSARKAGSASGWRPDSEMAVGEPEPGTCLYWLPERHLEQAHMMQGFRDARAADEELRKMGLICTRLGVITPSDCLGCRGVNYRVRSAALVLPRDVAWNEGAADALLARV